MIDTHERKAPFIATQLNSTGRPVELCCYKWGLNKRRYEHQIPAGTGVSRSVSIKNALHFTPFTHTEIIIIIITPNLLDQIHTRA